MPTPTNHWKVGLFVVAGFAVALCAVVYLGVAGLRRDDIVYHTYLDEPVQGLDVGAPVQFRGVKIGQVAEIGVAPDRRHVHVVCALFTRNLRQLGLAEAGDDGDVRIAVPADLRIQLVVVGLTGLKELQIDFVDASANPPPSLPFPVPRRYIPAAPSMLSKIGGSMTDAADRVPELADALLQVAGRADRILEQIERARLAETTAATLARADAAFAALQRGVDQAALGALSAQARRGLGRLDAVLARLDGDDGLVASVQRTSSALGDVAASSPALGEELTSALREIQEAAASIRRLADALERNPDMLIKGRRDRE